ncbi:MAG: hypothetical protein H5U19_06945 [Rhodobacteraceae bacterium]|nr:hypothetical protein [Paracoccaceae bacterium]
MPEEEAAHVARVYAGAGARVILEYGSGGTTRIAAGLPGKFVISVESDPDWARNLQAEIDGSGPASSVVVYHCDIGPVGGWGRPRGAAAWRRFNRYPLEVWEQPFFRPPDVVLIDGRLRAACLATVMLLTKKPVTVLFDDYGVRPLYHQVERLVRPERMIGRLAEFHVKPDMVRREDLGFVIGLFSAGSLDGIRESDYAASTPPW